MPFGNGRLRHAALALLLSAAALAARVSPAQAQEGFGFVWLFGYRSVGGDYGQILDGGASAEFDIFYQHNSLRYGGGVNYASYQMAEPYDSLESWSSLEAHVSFTYLFRNRSSFLPYVQLRGVFTRLRPRDAAFATDTVPPEPGESLTDPVSGFSGAVVAGAEIRLTSGLALDLSALFTRLNTGDPNLSAIGLEPLSSGTAWAGRAGVVWRP